MTNFQLTPLSSSNTPSSSTLAQSPKTTLKKNVLNKKKLEFAAQKHLEVSDDEEDQEIEIMDIDSLKAFVDKKQEELAILERHQAEKEELIEVIEKWKQAGLDTMEELRKHVDPSKTDAEVLDSFKIPHKFFL